MIFRNFLLYICVYIDVESNRCIFLLYRKTGGLMSEQHKAAMTTLNDRFKYAIQCLEERGDLVPSSRDKGISQFAELVLGNRKYGHLLTKFLAGERSFPIKRAQQFCDVYGVSYDFLMKGKGEPFVSSKYELQQPEAEALPKANILFSSMEAFASTAVDVSVYEESETFYIPGMQGEYIAFNIKGNSMNPTIADGDMVICRILEPHETVYDNEIYAVVMGNSVMVKRVQKIRGKNNEIVKFKLISDNYLEHDPFTILKSEVRRMLKVERRVTGLGL